MSTLIACHQNSLLVSSHIVFVDIIPVATSCTHSVFVLQNGFIVVEGVLASAHSEFILDGITPRSWVHLLPSIYQAMLKPVTALYNVIGPARAEALADILVGPVNYMVSSTSPMAIVASIAGVAAWRYTTPRK